MRWIRGASFEEFTRHYLSRERRKRGLSPDLRARSPEDLALEMRRLHPAKLRLWFEDARWSLVLLESIEESMTVVCLDSPETRKAGLVNGWDSDNRIAASVVAAAHEVGLFDEAGASLSECNGEFRQKRAQALA